ncbi:MAG TPA: alpha/beta hydrolase [Solirubrobacteraceae bacterium]|nr:alpha/beta hydrolase [Solirubrobacteraceae bacterium]
MPEVRDHFDEIDVPQVAYGPQPVFWRSAPAPEGAAGDAVPLYLHGVPDSCDEWIAPRAQRMRRPWHRRWWRRKRADDEWVQPPAYETGFLERSGGLAVDLPGFGRTGKPASLRYTIDEYGGWIERFLDHVEVERVQLVVHDWGAVGLAFAQRLPERVERLVIINAVPLLAGYRWHRTARIWRTPGLGELAMGTTSYATLRLVSREANATPGPLPEAWLRSVLAHFDQGTQRAILRLYRSSPPEALAAAGARLGALAMPALVLWGARDPYIPVRFAREYARALPSAELVEVPDAGHWPWLDRPELIERVADFLAGE